MEANKADSRDAEGLQAIQQENFPEVVGVHGQQPSRRDSMSSPEAYNAMEPQAINHEAYSAVKPRPFGLEPTQQVYQQEKGAYTSIPTGDYQGHRPPSSIPPQYSDYGAEKQQQPSASGAAPKERKILGMRRKVFFWVAAVVILLIVIAAVLGGVLGTVLNNDSNDSSNDASGTNSSSSQPSLAAKDKSGLAMLNGSDGLYTYYVDEAGAIVETNFGSKWNQNNTALPSTANVTTAADPNSPIAAITYLQGGTNYRQIFYFSDEGVVMTVNTTGDGTWQEAYAPIPSGLFTKPGAMALSAIAATRDSSTKGLNGIRVYFGSSVDTISEIGCDFTNLNPFWYSWANFTGSDPLSGVSSVLVGEVNHLYLRNSTTGQLAQYMWDYANPEAWIMTASSSESNGVAPGGSIAAATDGSNTDYIFYQTSRSATGVVLFSGSGSTLDAPSTSLQSIQSAPQGYSLAATYTTSSGAVVLNQDSKDSSQLLFTSVNRNGQSQEYTTETGNGS